MAAADASRRQEALDWARRLHDPSFADWDAHLAWLERSPENACAFDEAVLDMEAATAGLAPSAGLAASAVACAANDDQPAGRGSRGWRAPALFGGALAACVVGSVALWNAGSRPDATYAVRTAAGKTRSIALADGSTIALNGDTELRLDRGSPRHVEIARGEALFTIAHDARRPFTVGAGDASIEDVGTVFDVTRTAGRTDVGVREGAVAYRRGGVGVRLAAGDTLRVAGSDAAVVRHVDPASVGGWRSGRLAYTQATMTDVADDLARATGARVSVDPALAGRRFTGVIALDGGRGALARRFEAVTGLPLRRDGEGWRIASPDR